jgi:hypothetical protein
VAFVHPSLSLPENILEKFSTNLDLSMIGLIGKYAGKLWTFRPLNLQETTGEPDFTGFLSGACKPIYLNLNKSCHFHDADLPQ